MDWELWTVAVCMILSFLFSASETAITSLGRLEVQTLQSRGGQTARLIHMWVRNPSHFLTTVLVGNNAINTIASAVLTIWLKEKYPLSLKWALGIFTVSFILLSEITPKLLARQHALNISVYALSFLRIVAFIIAPINLIMNFFTSGLSLLSGMPGRDLRKPMTEDELTQTIEFATKDGGIDRATGEVLSNLIGFPDRIARDVMVHRTTIQAIQVGWNLDQVMRFIATDGHSRYPVIRNSLDEIVGLLLVKDILNHIQRGNPGSWTRVIRKTYYISELTALGLVLKDMKRAGTHLALVRNETGVLTGLLTLEDLIEEILGNIRDEHDDPSEGGNEAALGGPRLVTGEMPIVDFNDRYRASLPVDSGYSTLNGYLLTRTGGQLPAVGTLIFADDVTFRIHAVEESGIATLEIMDQFVRTES